MILNHFPYGFGWLSWSAVFAGAIAALAIWLVMAVIGVALGFKVVEPKSDEPAAGLGKTLGLWYGVSVIVSLAAGGFMAGLFAGHKGAGHGFLVWALVTIVLTCAGSHVAGTAARGLFNAVKSLGSGVSDLASGVGKTAAQAASDGASRLMDEINGLNLDKIADNLNDNVVSVLRDTGNEALQPENIKSQLREARGDLRKLARQIALEPTGAGRLVSEFLETEKKRLKDVADEVDRDTAVSALMKNRGIPRDEAEKMVDNAVGAYQTAVNKAQEKLADINEQVEDLKDNLKEAADQARDKADKVTAAASKGAAATAAALILAALLSSGFGLWGAACADHQPPPHHKTFKVR